MPAHDIHVNVVSYTCFIDLCDILTACCGPAALISNTYGSIYLMSAETDSLHMRASGRARLAHHTHKHTHEFVRLSNHMYISWYETSKTCLLLAYRLRVVSHPKRPQKKAYSVAQHRLCYGSTQTAEQSCLQHQSNLQ